MIVIDGTLPGFFNSLAVIPPSGTSSDRVPAADVACVWTTFQAGVISGATITLSAATRISVS
jgi:hypothetical protein